MVEEEIKYIERKKQLKIKKTTKPKVAAEKTNNKNDNDIIVEDQKKISESKVEPINFKLHETIDLKTLIDDITKDDNSGKTNTTKLDKNVKKIMKSKNKMSDEKAKISFIQKLFRILLAFIVMTWFLIVTMIFLYYLNPDLFDEIWDFIEKALKLQRRKL